MSHHLGIDARFYSDHATGIGRHVYELIQQLAQLDTENHYTVFLGPKAYEAFTPPNERFSAKRVTARHYSLAEQTTFLRQINAEKLDLMIFPHFNAPVGYKRPFVVTIHDLTLHKFPGKKKNGWLTRLTYKYIIRKITRQAAHCFAVSEHTKKDMQEILSIPDSKITVTYNGISQIFHQPTANSQRPTAKYHLPEKYLLYTGVMRNHKNILGLIKAYHKAQDEVGSRQKVVGGIPTLVIAGPQDPVYFEEIQALCKSLSLPFQTPTSSLTPDSCLLTPVIFPGFIDQQDIGSVMAQAHAFVFPSFYEGFGIPPLEAMQCGVPVACSNASSLPEVCGDAVRYFDPYDIDDMAKSLSDISFDDSLRKKLVQKGSLQCQQFSWQKMAEKMLEVYHQILM